MSMALASFHPGHGTTSPGSVVHYLTEPVHAVVIVAALAALVVASAALWLLAFRKPSR